MAKHGSDERDLVVTLTAAELAAEMHRQGMTRAALERERFGYGALADSTLSYEELAAERWL